MQEKVAPRLSDVERQRYTECKQTLKDNAQACFAFAIALREIKTAELWRADYDSFAKFCDGELPFSRQYAYRLLDAAEVKSTEVVDGSKKLSTVVDNLPATTVPETANPEQAAVLSKVRPEHRPAVMAEAAKHGPVTAESIATATETVDKAMRSAVVPHGTPAPESSKPIIEFDATGFAIPEKLVPFWNRGAEVRKVLNAVSLVRSTLRTAQEEADLLYLPIAGPTHQATWTGILTNLDKAYSAIGQAVPYAVCTTCHGRLLDKCGTCQGRGFVSEFYYEHQLAAEDRRIREMAIQNRKDK